MVDFRASGVEFDVLHSAVDRYVVWNARGESSFQTFAIHHGSVHRGDCHLGFQAV